METRAFALLLLRVLLILLVISFCVSRPIGRGDLLLTSDQAGLEVYRYAGQPGRNLAPTHSPKHTSGTPYRRLMANGNNEASSAATKQPGPGNPTEASSGSTPIDAWAAAPAAPADSSNSSHIERAEEASKVLNSTSSANATINASAATAAPNPSSPQLDGGIIALIAAGSCMGVMLLVACCAPCCMSEEQLRHLREQSARSRAGAGHVSAFGLADVGGGVHSSATAGGFCGDFGGVDGGGWGDCGDGGDAGGGGDGGGE